MTLRSHEAYCQTGVEWFPEVPAHWEVKRLRFVADLNPSKTEVASYPDDAEVGFLPMEAVGERGELDLSRTRPIGEVRNGYSYFADGDVVFAKVTPCLENGKGALIRGLVGGRGFGTTELTVLRPKRAADGPYLWWLTYSSTFRGPAEGEMLGAGGLKRVPDEFVADYPAPWPPATERRDIAAFLGRETAKIDALVAEQRRLIELLKEKRQAVISHAVTKGLDSSKPMRDAGVKWLGEVPAHWELKPLRAHYRFVKRQQAADLDVLSVYRDYGVIRKSDRDDNINKTPEDLSSYQTVRPGDLVVNKMKAWQGSLGVSPLLGITSPDYAVFEATSDASGDYLNQLLRCRLLPDVYRSISNGIRPDQWRLEPQKFTGLKVPLPPATEQIEIVSYLSEECSRLLELEGAAEHSIDLLQERRAALISAAVIGKIDVRQRVTSREPERA